uniref:glycosyltransferase n=1 Tax=Cellulosilyticum ruminicola TaxID=425254 RepID=UPI0038B8F2F5
MEALMAKKKIALKSRIAFVNDGSKDCTWQIINALIQEDSLFVDINLAHNRGYQNALLAGLMVAKENADSVSSLDADLQDDIQVIEKFVDAYIAGNDIVYGDRSSRQKIPSLNVLQQKDFIKSCIS